MVKEPEGVDFANLTENQKKQMQGSAELQAQLAADVLRKWLKYASKLGMSVSARPAT